MQVKSVREGFGPAAIWYWKLPVTSEPEGEEPQPRWLSFVNGEADVAYRVGYQFAPRYRDLYDKVRTSLYGFKHPSQYANLVLKPIQNLADGSYLAKI